MRIVEMRIVAVDPHRLEKAQRCQRLWAAERELDQGAIHVGPEQERLVGVPFVRGEGTRTDDDDQYRQAEPLQNLLDHSITCMLLNPRDEVVAPREFPIAQ